MQRRERILFGVVGLLAGGWLLDSALLGPGLAWYDRVREQTRKAGEEAAQSRALVDRQARILADWRAHHAAGLLDDEAAARFRVQSALAEAARTGGVVLDNVSGGQLVPAARDETCDTLRLTASGQGTLAQVMAFTAALEGAAQPLRIERSELSASDARKDQIELAMTVSTRLVPAAARAKRSVPAGTAAWTPEAPDRTAGAATVAARPFLADRRGGARQAAVDGAAKTVAAAPGGWALVGIVARHDGNVAFMRHLGDGSERVLAVGDEFDGRTASAIDAGGLTLGGGAEPLRVAVGVQLDGTPVPAASRQSAPAAAPRAAVTAQPGTAAAVPAPATPSSSTDTGREAILERLRQQRNRTP